MLRIEKNSKIPQMSSSASGRNVIADDTPGKSVQRSLPFCPTKSRAGHFRYFCIFSPNKNDFLHF